MSSYASALTNPPEEVQWGRIGPKSKSSNQPPSKKVQKTTTRQSDLIELSMLFDGSFPKTTIESVYENNKCNKDAAIDALLALSTTCSVSSSSSSHIPNKIIGSCGTQNNSSLRNTFTASCVNVSNPISNAAKAGAKPQATNVAETSNGLKPQKSKKNQQAERDKEAYRQWSVIYQELLSSNDLEDIWSQVQRDHWGDNLDAQQKAEVATIYAQQKLDLIFDNANSSETCSSSGIVSSESGPSSSIEHPLSNDESDHVVSFKRLFVDIISNEQLESIWRTISNEKLSFQEKEELAILYTMEILEAKQAGELEDPNSVDLLELMSFQEAQRLERMEHNIQKANWKQFSKLEKSQSTQEVALQMVTDIFKDSNSKYITQQRISEILIKCHYDIEEAISTICQETLRDGHFTRHNVSYANALKIENNNEISNQRAIINKGSAKKIVTGSTTQFKVNNNNLLSISMTPNRPIEKTPEERRESQQQWSQDTKPNLLFRARQKANSIHQYRFGLHFLNVVKAKNPLLRVELNNDGEIIYTGMNPHYGQRRYDDKIYANVLMITIDLHGLPLVQALQIVDSSIDYYRDVFDGRKDKIERVTIRYVVGRGVHSPGGIAKMRPAVVNLLNDRNETNYVVCEGEIMLNISFS